VHFAKYEKGPIMLLGVCLSCCLFIGLCACKWGRRRHTLIIPNGEITSLTYTQVDIHERSGSQFAHAQSSWWFGSAQEVNWHISRYQFTLCTILIVCCSWPSPYTLSHCRPKQSAKAKIPVFPPEGVSLQHSPPTLPEKPPLDSFVNFSNIVTSLGNTHVPVG